MFKKIIEKLREKRTRQILKKIIEIAKISYDSEVHYYVISKNPIIVLTYADFWHISLFHRLLRKKRVYFLRSMKWSKESNSALSIIKKQMIKNKRRFPNHEVIFLCNSPAEYEQFGKFGIPRIFCNHNCFLDEEIYKIIPDTAKEYDAIYDAAMIEYKRHYLASKVKNFALITFITDHAYFMETKNILPEAIWLNFASGDYEWISKKKLIKYFNQSRVGLCLSAEEGAMFASTEYLLCGLPVVSTRSKGGRDVFFDEEYVKIVDDTPEAVEEGVKEMMKREIPPDYIREKTIEKMKPHRERFIELVQQIYNKEGVDRSFREEWSRIFINKMYRSGAISIVAHCVD